MGSQGAVKARKTSNMRFISCMLPQAMLPILLPIADQVTGEPSGKLVPSSPALTTTHRKGAIMADNNLHCVPTGTRSELSSGLFRAALAFEDITIDVQRVRQTAYVLACSELLTEEAQSSFYALADLCGSIHAKSKGLEKEFTEISLKQREATDAPRD